MLTVSVPFVFTSRTTYHRCPSFSAVILYKPGGTFSNVYTPGAALLPSFAVWGLSGISTMLILSYCSGIDEFSCVFHMVTVAPGMPTLFWSITMPLTVDVLLSCVPPAPSANVYGAGYYQCGSYYDDDHRIHFHGITIPGPYALVLMIVTLPEADIRFLS